MPPSIVKLAAFAGLIGCTAPALAQESLQIRPGMWEVAMTGNPQKHSMCFTPAMVKDIASLSQQKQPDSDCKASGDSLSGNTRTFNVSCTRPNKYDAKISITFNGPDNFTMKQDYSMAYGGKAQSGTMSMTYRRTGDCK